MIVSIRWSLMMVLVVSLVGATACGTGFGTRTADVLVPVEKERQLGEEIEAELREELTFVDDEELTKYVRQLGTDILRGISDRPRELRIRFHVVDDDNTVNAFAVPGGGIYVYTGLIKAMDNEAELTAVISHEIAHVTRRHIAQRLVAFYGVDVVTQMALGQEPGLVKQLAAAVVQQGFLLKYSRDQEYDADKWGVKYHVDAGYDPRGFVSFFQKLDGPGQPPTFLSTHPAPTDRIDRIRRMIRELDNIPTRQEEERFVQMRDRI